MINTIEWQSGVANPWAIVGTLFPSLRVRFAMALLVTFFPLGILYPLEWPVRELVTLFCWLCVFPSIGGLLCLALLPVLRSDAYGYWAFNVICFIAALAIARSASRCRSCRGDVAAGLHRFARLCVLLTLIIAAWQVFSRPEAWSQIFYNMSLGEGGRGSGLRLEPSLLAAPLAIYLALLVWRIESTAAARESGSGGRKFLLEGLLAMSCALLVTRSFSVLVITACFSPFFFSRLKNTLLPVAGLFGGTVVAALVYGERVRQALEDAGSSVVDLITVGASSWRNIPDLLIILNYADFLLPGNPAGVRDRINTFAMGWSVNFAWIENTYSTFSAGASTFGLAATVCLFIAGAVIGLRALSSGAVRTAWFMLYVANWFVTPKFEAAGWAALGLLTLLYRPSGAVPESWVNRVNKAFGLPLFPTVKLTRQLHGVS